jgi:ABC-type multidrug transport system permease subunit
MSTDSVARLRLNAAWVVGVREFRAAMRGLGVYVMATAALAAAGWALLADVRAVRSSGLLVHANPFGVALAAAVFALALFLAVSAVVSAARDRERGTMEVLFYGPVDEFAYVVGKVGGLLAVYVALLPVLLVALLVIGAMTGFLLSGAILLGLVLSIIPAAEIVGFGVLLSIATNRVRTAILLFIAVVALLIGLSIAYTLVLLVPIEDPSSPMLPVRDGLAAANAVAVWVSPFTYVDRVVESSLSGAWRTALWSLAAAVCYAAATIVLAAAWLRRRGVARKGE